MYKAEKRRKEIKRQAKKEAKMKRRLQKADGEMVEENGTPEVETAASAEPAAEEPAAGDEPS